MTRPLLLDLFCGAGGAAMGYHRAGFDVVGVDIKPQPDYPFEFKQTDALDALEWLTNPDAVHASPPCQGYTPMTNRHPSIQPKLIAEVREMLWNADVPYVIENVPGAPLLNPVRLCGSAFGLATYRHRLFETNFPMFATPCWHRGRGVAVYGPPDGRRLYDRADGTQLRAWASLEEGQEALGVPWISDWHGVREAIPPAYTEYIGRQLIEHLEQAELRGGNR